jgi:ubiquinone/menaquinone biosynthesis C-methylase UbiE
MVSKAREKLGAGVDLRVGDAESLPWPSDSFDVVTINLSFHHYEHPAIVLEEVRRVLANEGRVIIGDVCLPFHLNRLANLLMRFRHEGGVHFYSEKEMRSLLNKAGFNGMSWNRTTRRAFVVNARVSKQAG